MHFTRQARRLRHSALAGPLIQVGQLLLWCIGFYPMGEIGEIARSAPYPPGEAHGTDLEDQLCIDSLTAALETAPGAFWNLELMRVAISPISRPPRANHEARQQPMGSNSGKQPSRGSN